MRIVRYAICLAVAALLSSVITVWVLATIFSRDVAVVLGTLLGAVLGCVAVVVARLWDDYDHGLL